MKANVLCTIPKRIAMLSKRHDCKYFDGQGTNLNFVMLEVLGEVIQRLASKVFEPKVTAILPTRVSL